MSSNFLSLNPSKSEFLIFSLPQQLSKLNNPTIHLPNNVILSPVDSARNLGVIFDKNLSFAQHISAVSKSCFQYIRDLRRIRNTIDQTIACTIATSLIHSKIKMSKEPRSFEFLMQRVSVAIQRGNAACILGTMPNASDLADIFYL